MPGCLSIIGLALLCGAEGLKLQSSDEQWPMFPNPWQQAFQQPAQQPGQQAQAQPQQQVQQQEQAPAPKQFDGWTHDRYGFHPPYASLFKHREPAAMNYKDGQNKDDIRRNNNLERGTAHNIFPYDVDPSCWTTKLWRTVSKKSQQCMNQSMSFPVDSQFLHIGRNATENLRWDIVGQVSQVYLLCHINCDAVKIPAQWKGKVTLISGAKADDCFGTQDDPHNRKITLVHKMFLVHAKENKYDTIGIIEDDFALTTYHGYSNTDITNLKSFVQTGNWDMIRLAWRWYAPLYGKSHAGYNECRKECICTKTTESSHMCTMNPGCEDVTGSSSYLVHSSGYDKMIATGGCIDNTVMGILRSHVMLPSMLATTGATTGELPQLEKVFTDNCVRE